MNSKLTTLALLALIGTSTSSLGATWQVELDGSGDFTDIQDAVDASAAGDTVLIGLGRFDTIRAVPGPSPGYFQYAIVGITQDDLTIIGSGRGVTIIGLEFQDSYYGIDYNGIGCLHGYECTIKNLTIEHVYCGVYWSFGGLELEGCDIKGEGPFFTGISALCDRGLSVVDCHFELTGPNTFGIINDSPNACSEIRHCRFVGGAPFSGRGLSSTILEDCTFESSRSGVSFTHRGTGFLRNCQFNDCGASSVLLRNQAHLQLNDCSIEGGEMGVVVADTSSLVGTSNVIANTTDIGLWIRSQSVVNLTNSHLLPVSGPAVKCSFFFDEPDIFQELTHNFWGTNNPAEIAAMIVDGNDDPSIHSFINFMPFAGQPVSTESMTWDGVKALFR
nr:right-handed parallel beta-helix repeat-containing protein [Candidatus Krumholzibacteria bacterium]